MALSEVRPGQFSTPEMPIISANPLARHIEEEIDKNGPIPFDKYMNVWLNGARTSDGKFHPGYYNSGEAVIGNNDVVEDSDKTDFITPCEYTPLYGYCMAEQLLEMRNLLGNPADFTIVEMGAGNGTLAYDILHAIEEKVKSGEADEKALNTRYVIVETSEALIEKQRTKLDKFSNKVNFILGSASELPLKGITGVFLSVELPDAFPTRIVSTSNDYTSSLKELYIDKGDDTQFSEVWSSNLSPEVERCLLGSKVFPFEKELKAVNLNAERWMKDVGRALDKGFVITVDYSDKGTQAVRTYMSKAKKEVELADLKVKNWHLSKAAVGKIDMTQGVDFEMLSDAGHLAGLDTLGYVNQQGFLWGLGFENKMYREGINFGDRKFNLSMAVELLKSHSWDVMVQAKGLDVNPKLVSIAAPFDPEMPIKNADKYKF